MSGGFGFFVAVAAGWLAVGLVLSVVMGRRGHSSYGWLVLGTLLGPLAMVLALDAWRHDERLGPATLGGEVTSTPGSGPVDVLVGYDGSPDSIGAMEAAIGLLGDRLGRLTVATVVPYGGVKEQERLADEALRRLADGRPGRPLELAVLHGHPSVALHQYAIERGDDLIAVGVRGKGASKAILGSAAVELSRTAKIPVLLAGDR